MFCFFVFRFLHVFRFLRKTCGYSYGYAAPSPFAQNHFPWVRCSSRYSSSTCRGFPQQSGAVCPEKKKDTFSWETALFAPGCGCNSTSRECNSPVVSSDLDRLILVRAPKNPILPYTSSKIVKKKKRFPVGKALKSEKNVSSYSDRLFQDPQSKKSRTLPLRQ